MDKDRFAKRVLDISPSATLLISAEVKRLKKEGFEVIGFGAGEPDFDTPDSIKDAAIQAIKENFTRYTPACGIIELREAICSKLKTDNKLDYKPNQIVVSCGAKHSIFNILEVLCEHGDEVILPVPYWVSYPEMIKLTGAKVVFVKTESSNNFKLTKDALKKAITKNTKAIILNSPSNPTGCVYTKDELEFIAKEAVNNKIWVISDEIYEKIIFDTNEHVSIASLSKDIYNLAIVVNGVSKSFCMTGWRIGYIAGPAEVATLIDNLQSHTTSNPTSISQKAALAALKGDQACLASMVKEFQRRRDFMIDKLSNIKGISLVKPGGAFYLFCDISGAGLTSVEFSKRLLEIEKVAVVPGKEFGFDTHIRLSFATDIVTIEKGLDRIERFINSL